MKSVTVTAAYAKANLGALLERVKHGERLTILRYNKPVAELAPPAESSRPIPKLGTGKGKVKILDRNWADPLTEKELNDLFS